MQRYDLVNPCSDGEYVRYDDVAELEKRDALARMWLQSLINKLNVDPEKTFMEVGISGGLKVIKLSECLDELRFAHLKDSTK